MSPAAGAPARRALLPVLILLCAVLPYLGALDGGFVWTDHHFVEGNESLRTWSSVPRMFVTDAWQVREDPRSIGYYRPVRNLTFFLDTQVFGPAPIGYHFTNLVLHALCSLLVFGIVRRVFAEDAPAGGGLHLAFWSAVLFAVHPVHIEAVAWITGRTDSTAALGFLFALYAWLQAFGARVRWGWWVLGCAGAVWGLLAKESAATLPAALALCLWFRNHDGDRRVPSLAVRCLPAAVLTVLYLAVRGAVLSSVTNHPYWGGTVWTNGLTAISLTGPYARLLAFGTPLVAIYEEHLRTAVTEPAVLLGLGIIGATLAGGGLYRRFPHVAFAAAWTAITILPVMQILPFKVLLAERFLYLPSVGWCVLVATGFSVLARKRAALATVGAAVIAGAYAIGTVRHVPVWDNDFALFEDSLRHQPNAPEAVMALARAHLDAGHHEQARDGYVRATELAPSYYLGWYNRGLAHLNLGEARPAYEAFRQATLANPDYVEGWWPLGRSAYGVDELEAAAKAFGVAAGLRPTEENYQWWGRALARAERWDEAADVFDRAIAGGASAPLFLAEAGTAFVTAGRGADGEARLAQARAADARLVARVLAEAENAAATGEPGHARYLASVALRVAPDHFAALDSYVRLTPEPGLAAAVTAVEVFVANNSEHLEAARLRVDLLLATQQAPAAADAAHALVAAFPDAPQAHATYAAERLQAGDGAAALEAARRAAELAPDQPAWWMLVGEYTLKGDNPEEAILAYERADALVPDTPTILRGLGRAYLAAGRLDDAAHAARRGLQRAPNDPGLLAVLDVAERAR